MTNEEAKAFLDNLKICIDEHPIVADWLVEIANRKTEPKTQMKTQNSNLTFEKDECAKEYEELGLKELKELIEADRKTEPSNSEIPNNCKDDEYWEHLFVEVVKGHMSDAEANQAWYEYINHKDEPQTERSE